MTNYLNDGNFTYDGQGNVTDSNSKSYERLMSAFDAYKKDGNLAPMANAYNELHEKADQYSTIRGAAKLCNNSKVYTIIPSYDDEKAIEGFRRSVVKMALNESDFSTAAKWEEYKSYIRRLYFEVADYDRSFDDDQTPMIKRFRNVRAKLLDVVLFLKNEFGLEKALSVNSTNTHSFISMTVKNKTHKGAYSKTPTRQNLSMFREFVENMIRCAVNDIDLTVLSVEKREEEAEVVISTKAAPQSGKEVKTENSAVA